MFSLTCEMEKEHVKDGSLFMAGIAPKRKGLDKPNFGRVKSWVNEKQKTLRFGSNKNLLSFPKYDSLKI